MDPLGRYQQTLCRDLFLINVLFEVGWNETSPFVNINIYPSISILSAILSVTQENAGMVGEMMLWLPARSAAHTAEQHHSVVSLQGGLYSCPPL